MEVVINQDLPTAWIFLGFSWIMQFLFICGTTGIGFNNLIRQKIIALSDRKGALSQFLHMGYYYRFQIFGVRFAAGIALLFSILGSLHIIYAPFRLNINLGLALTIAVLNAILQLILVWGLKKTVLGLREGTIKGGWAIAQTEMLLVTNSKHYISWMVIAIVLNVAFIIKCCLLQ